MSHLLHNSKFSGESLTRFGLICRWMQQSAWPLLIAAFFLTGPALFAQTANRIRQEVDNTQVQVLPNHLPQWANAGNSAGLVPANQMLDHLTLVLSPSQQQQLGSEQFLADQQNPTSPDYHHWLTPAEVGERFGLSEQDVASVAGWLQSQGLHVNWVSPSRIFVGFGGKAADVNRAFQTELNYYNVNGVQHMSVSSGPKVPAALAPAIKAIRGLYTIEDQPQHFAGTMASDAPEMNASNGSHFLAPADFATIYDLNGRPGEGQTIGIVGVSRTDTADFDNFRQKTLTNFSNPIEVVPTIYGGVDPGPAFTAPPGTGVSIGAQGEATLDVLRAGSTAPSAQLLLVIASRASGGIDADAQYLVQTWPVLAQVMTISFGACESAAGPSGVAYWDKLFHQAAMEGISVLVSSGDAGASGCDVNFATPPAIPQPNSPNYICSSSYATCVGGTEFADAGNPSLYWSTTNASNLSTAFGYIPEGGWNEPLNASSKPVAASSGGGVSSFIKTPSWQTGTGVPAARTGRYTPDISFSSSAHDGYFACFAAAGASCVSDINGRYIFEYFAGTSAAAPAMAGVAALLDQTVGNPQGNLNPLLYQMAATTPSAFHDVTVPTSGVTNCDINTPSMCNNSIPSSTGLTGGQAGFLVSEGYDLVTGLGSLDIDNFVSLYPAPPTIKILNSSAGLSFGTQILGFSLTDGLVVQNSGSALLNPLSIAISGTNASDFTQTNDCQAALSAGSACTIQLTFTPKAAGTRTATLTVASSNGVNSPQAVAMTGTGSTTLLVPNVFLNPYPANVTVAQALTVTVAVFAQVGGYPAPTGSVILSGGGFTSTAVTLNGGNASVNVPAGSLAIGNDILTANYTPDAASSSLYNNASGSYPVLVTAVPPPSFTITGTQVNLAPGATTGNTSTITVTPIGGFTGSVTLTAAVTASPTGAKDPPTFSFGSTNPVNIAGASAGTATLTVSTTAPVPCTGAYLDHRGLPWYAPGGAVLACILLFGIPARRRRWQTMLGMMALLVTLACGVSACGGGSGPATCTTAISGTTIGSYTVAVTASSGTLIETGTVALTVQ